MKKAVKDYEAKTAAVLAKDAEALRKEIAKLNLEAKSNPQKDTNNLIKKRKQLAVLLTVMNGKKAKESAKPEVK